MQPPPRPAAPLAPPPNDEGCNGVCTYNSGTDDLTCQLDDNGGTADSAAQALVVSDYFDGTTTWDYAAWGTTTGGNDFTCEFMSGSSDPIDRVVLIGGTASDDLCFQDDGRGSAYSTLTLDLAGSTTGLVGVIQGGDQEDRILGSSSTDANYQDELFGQGHEDDILGDDGDDLIDGGALGDNICGEGGLDELIGGTGGDYLYGGDGVDTLYGGDDGDSLFGNADDDVCYGENGNDNLAGGPDDDTLYGGPDNDTLDGNAGTNTKDGGTGTDGCDGAGTNTNCETGGMFSSVTCPW